MSLISRQISRDWDLTTKLLQSTLDSIANQTEKNYQVLIGCHEIPSVNFNHNEKISFIPMDYSPKSDLGSPPARDRYIKLYTALHTLKDSDFDYCMALDADDHIHKDLLLYIKNQPKMDAWAISKGFELDYSSKRVFPRNNIDSICGSTLILSRKTIGVPQAISQEELKSFYYTANGHQDIKPFCQERKLQLGSVPFYAVQYVLNHGLNWSDITRRKNYYYQIKQVIKWDLLSRKMSAQDLENFGYKFNQHKSV
jgi:hypothetical protein